MQNVHDSLDTVAKVRRRDAAGSLSNRTNQSNLINPPNQANPPNLPNPPNPPTC